MNKDQNSSLWQLSRKSVQNTIKLNHHEKADVAIIGGGFTGLSAALRLAENGVNVALVEAEYHGYGGSGRNVGLTNAGLWLNPDEIEKAIGEKYANRLNHFLAKAPDLVHNLIDQHQIDCASLRNGTLHLAHSKKGMEYIKNRAEQLNNLGAGVTVLNQEETFKLTAAENYLGSILDKRSGTIQPLEYCFGLSVTAQKAGAKIYTNSPAIDVKFIDKKWQIKTPEGLITAEKVFLATNAYLEKIFPEIESTLTPLYYCQMATDPLNEEQLKHYLPGKNGTWDTRTVMRSYRTDDKERLLIGTIGNIHTKDASMLVSWSNKMIRETFPKIGPVEWTYKWAGRLACPNDFIPKLHDLGNGLYSCSGYSGRGIAPGTAFGHKMADFIRGTIAKEDLPLSFSPIKKVPLNKLRELFFETGSQLSHLYDHF